MTNLSPTREETFQKNFGKTIRNLREMKGQSLSSLAQEISVDYNFMGEVERGNRNMYFRKLPHLARALGVSVGGLFHNNDCLNSNV